MIETASSGPVQEQPLRTLLHDANNELSIAVLQLGILLEDAALQPALKGSVEDSLAACSRAAAVLRELWALLDHGAARR